MSILSDRLIVFDHSMKSVKWGISLEYKLIFFFIKCVYQVNLLIDIKQMPFILNVLSDVGYALYIEIK